jgi:hypothetical protein
MSTTQTPQTSAGEAAIFSRVFADSGRSLTPELARHILTLEFNDDDKARMHELAVKNQEGRISPEELRELDSYIKSAHWGTLCLVSRQSGSPTPLGRHGRG